MASIVTMITRDGSVSVVLSVMVTPWCLSTLTGSVDRMQSDRQHAHCYHALIILLRHHFERCDR